MWIDIYSVADHTTRLGAGPIASVTAAQITRRLDQAGGGSFTMSAVDERRSLVQARRWAVCRGIIGNMPADLGSFIIDSLSTDLTAPGAPELTVSGDDLLRELAQRTVGELGIYEDDLRVLGYLGGSTGANAAAIVSDGDVTTAVHAVVEPGGNNTYIGSQTPFNRVRFRFKNPNRFQSSLSVDYLKTGGTWASMSASDKTAYTDPITGYQYAWYRDGDVELTVPGDWTIGTHNGYTGYFIRMNGGSGTLSADVGEMRTINRTATTHGLARIAAYFPPGWTLDASGQSSTSVDVRMQFAGESVLAALSSLADNTGDHFVLGAGRSVKWLYSSDIRQGPNVLTAIQSGDGIALEANPDVCLVMELTPTQDTYPVVSRIYPMSSGSETERVTLAQTTRAAPSGYTLDKINNYLRRNSTEAAYGRSETWETFSEITPALQTAEARALAADFLFDAALAYLERYSLPNAAYTLRLARCERVLLPGEKIRLIYNEWRDGVKVIGVDGSLILLETTVVYDQNGARTTTVTAATIDSWPPSDGGLIAGFAAKLRHASGSGVVGTAAQQAGGNLTEVEVRDLQDVVIFRADHESETATFGPSTTPHIEYDGANVLVAGVPVRSLVAQAGMGAGAVRVEATPYTMAVNDCIVIATGTDDLTLPATAAAAGRHYTVKRLTGGYLIADTEIVDFGSSHPEMSDNDTLTLVSDGTYWYVIARVT